MKPRLARSCTNVVFSSRTPAQPGNDSSTGYRVRCDDSAAFSVAPVRTQRSAENKPAPFGRYGARPSPLPGSAGYQSCTDTGQPPGTDGSEPVPERLISHRTVPTVNGPAGGGK